MADLAALLLRASEAMLTAQGAIVRHGLRSAALHQANDALCQVLDSDDFMDAIDELEPERDGDE